MKYYLIKWQGDTNDADYVYGIEVATELRMNKIIAIGHKSIWVGEYAERQIDDCYSYEEITKEQYNTIKDLELNGFGETFDWQIDDIFDEDEE